MMQNNHAQNAGMHVHPVAPPAGALYVIPIRLLPEEGNGNVTKSAGFPLDKR